MDAQCSRGLNACRYTRKIHHWKEPMKRLIPSPSMAVALVALVSSLGTGGAFAATQLAKNSVGSAQIRNGSVTMSDLAKTARPSKDNRLFRTAVAETVSTDQVLAALSDAVEGDQGPAGATGATGSTGATGATGAQGAPGAIVTSPGAEHSPVISVGPGGFQDVTVNCPTGKAPVGGVGTPSGNGSIAISELSGNGWHVRLQSDGGAASAIATVFCA
jgi:hypothetical protein